MSPALELIFNPLAGPAGFNLVSFMFYVLITICTIGAVVEHFKFKR